MRGTMTQAEAARGTQIRVQRIQGERFPIALYMNGVTRYLTEAAARELFQKLRAVVEVPQNDGGEP